MYDYSYYENSFGLYDDLKSVKLVEGSLQSSLDSAPNWAVLFVQADCPLCTSTALSLWNHAPPV